jgi:hypothetical protein
MTVPQQIMVAQRRVVSGSTTFDSGSGNFTVPAYNTLVVEGWGGGSPGMATTPPATFAYGTDGGDTTVSTLSLTAGGGKKTSGTGAGTPGAGGVATGGDVNTSGSQGVAGGAYNGVNGQGGASPNGGATTPPPVGQGVPGLFVVGNNGNLPGAGGSAPTYNVSGSQFNTCGGSGGAYVKKTYSLGAPGAPSPGALLAYAVGAGGVADTSLSFDPGSGANGRVRFTWS